MTETNGNGPFVSRLSRGWGQVLTLGVTVLMAAFGVTWQLSGQISGVSRDVAQISERLKNDESLMQAQALTISRIPLAEQRIDNLSKIESDHYAESLARSQSTSSKLEVILDRLSDLRVQMGVKPTERR